jgi:hypothetical protein
MILVVVMVIRKYAVHICDYEYSIYVTSRWLGWHYVGMYHE